MTRLNVFAYTALGCGYPPYVSINAEEDGRVVMHVRGLAKPDGSCGDAVSIEIPRSEIPDLIRGLTAIEPRHG
jgi:hypothetical protein